MLGIKGAINIPANSVSRHFISLNGKGGSDQGMETGLQFFRDHKKRFFSFSFKLSLFLYRARLQIGLSPSFLIITKLRFNIL
jgi:hypothetical protein